MEESFSGSVQLMLFVYALAAAISFFIAWVLRLIFTGIKTHKARSDARNDTPVKGTAEGGDDAADRKA